MLTFAVIVTGIAQLLIAAYVLKKGRGNVSYILFFWLSVLLACWNVFNYLSIILSDTSYITYIVRGIMVFSTLNVGMFYMFAHVFPTSRVDEQIKEAAPYVLLTLLVAIVAASPLLFESVTPLDGRPIVSHGPGILLFGLFVIYSIFSAFRVLIRKQRVASGLKRNQIRILLVAAAINWIIIPITNFVVTLLLKTLFFVIISPIYSLAFCAIIAYALLKHRMFDSKTKLQASTIYVDYYLKNPGHRALEYYQLQTTVYESGSNHIALDFSGIKDLKKGDVRLLNYLRSYMAEQGKKIYFIGYSQKVFNKLRDS